MRTGLRMTGPGALLATGVAAVAGIASLAGPILSDEVFTIDVCRLPWTALYQALAADVHPPLYYFVAKLWMTAFGSGVVALRSLSAVCAWLAALLIWKLALDRTQGDAAAAAPVALLANPIVILMCGYGRMYTLLLLACVATLWAIREMKAAPFALPPRLALAACAAWGCLTHYWFAFFLLSVAAVEAIELWRATGRRPAAEARLPIKHFVASMILGAAAFAALWGPESVQQLTNRGQQLAWVRPPDIATLLSIAGTHLVLLAAGAAIAFVAVAVQTGRRKARPPRLPWLMQSGVPGHAAGALLALLAPWIVSQWRPAFNPRFTIIVAPWLALIGLECCQHLRARAARTAAVCLALAAAAWAGAAPWRIPACNSRSAAIQLGVLAHAGDIVVFGRLARQPIEWYWHPVGVERRSFPAAIDTHPGYEGSAPDSELRKEASALAARAVESHRRVFVVGDTRSRPSRILMEALEQHGLHSGIPCMECASASNHYFDRLLLFSAD